MPTTVVEIADTDAPAALPWNTHALQFFLFSIVMPTGLMLINLVGSYDPGNNDSIGHTLLNLTTWDQNISDSETLRVLLFPLAPICAACSWLALIYIKLKNEPLSSNQQLLPSVEKALYINERKKQRLLQTTHGFAGVNIFLSPLSVFLFMRFTNQKSLLDSTFMALSAWIGTSVTTLACYLTFLSAMCFYRCCSTDKDPIAPTVILNASTNEDKKDSNPAPIVVVTQPSHSRNHRRELSDGSIRSIVREEISYESRSGSNQLHATRSTEQIDSLTDNGQPTRQRRQVTYVEETGDNPLGLHRRNDSESSLIVYSPIGSPTA